MHGFLIYAICGIGTALVIATVDLLSPKHQPMGVSNTLLCGTLWPGTLAIMAYIIVRRLLRRRGL